MFSLALRPSLLGRRVRRLLAAPGRRLGRRAALKAFVTTAAVGAFGNTLTSRIALAAAGGEDGPDVEVRPAVRIAEEAPPARASRFFVPGGPNSEYGINQTDDYEIPAILRKQMD